MKKVAALVIAAVLAVAVVASCSTLAKVESAGSVISIEVGSGAFWAFVTALSAIASVIAQVFKKVWIALPGLLSSAVAAAVVIFVVYLIGWVQLIPPGIGSWLGLWFLTYLSACGLFDSATLKGLLPPSAGGKK